MSHVKEGLKYTDSHEWVELQGDSVVIGITDHAQELLGDVVYVELPEIGQAVSSGDEAGVVESVKSASDIYAPVTGEILEVNSELEANPELVNSSPYSKGWLYKVKLTDADQLDEMMTATQYKSCIEE